MQAPEASQRNAPRRLKHASGLFNQRKEIKMVKCPKCGASAVLKCVVRPAATVAGVGAGGYVALTAGLKTGTAVGSAICPGIGTVIGGLLGVLAGAASGAVAGNTVGKLVDENVIRIYQCPECSYSWRSA